MSKDKVLNTEELQAICARLFQTEEGKILLDELNRKYSDSKIADPSKEPAYAYFNEGRRDVIRFINNCIKKTKQSKQRSK